MRKVLFMAVPVFLAASVFAQSTPWFEGSFDDAKTMAARENKHLLVDFSMRKNVDLDRVLRLLKRWWG